MFGREGTLKSVLTGELAGSGFIGELPRRVEDDIENDDAGRCDESANTEGPPGAAGGEGKDGVVDVLGSIAGADPSL